MRPESCCCVRCDIFPLGCHVRRFRRLLLLYETTIFTEKPSEHVLDKADYTGPTPATCARCYTIGNWPALKGLSLIDNEAGINDLSEVCTCLLLVVLSSSLEQPRDHHSWLLCGVYVVEIYVFYKVMVHTQACNADVGCSSVQWKKHGILQINAGLLASGHVPRTAIRPAC